MIDNWHPDDNQCALFIEGTLDDATTKLITRHVARCNDCLEIIGGAVRSFRDRSWWQQPAVWGIAAAIVVAVIGLAVFQQWRTATAINDIIAAAAAHDKRPVEPRISSFPYARYPVYRGANDQDEEQNPFELPAYGVLDKTQHSSSANALHARGIARLVLKEYQPAIDELTKAARNSKDAHFWNDLGAAQIAAQRYTDALPSLNRALQLDPNLREAQFNRALALEYSHDPQALAAWRAYAKSEPNPQWAAEAREKHIDRLQP
jgi:tetratricopeptide (TPR) repeat protein